jgi:hypothetical protein
VGRVRQSTPLEIPRHLHGCRRSWRGRGLRTGSRGVVWRRAEEGGGVEWLAEAKVCQANVAVAADEEVIGLYVAMDVSKVMNNFERKKEGCGVELGGVVCQDVLALQGWRS